MAVLVLIVPTPQRALHCCNEAAITDDRTSKETLILLVIPAKAGIQLNSS